MTNATFSDDEAAVERAAIQGESNVLVVTLFPNAKATRKREARLTWDELVARVRKPKRYPTKAAMPLVKLARFGALRSDKHCLRHDANLLAITGVEGDYDAETLTLEDAAMAISEHVVHAVLYTSPSSTERKPRWRVLCPLSHELPPFERRGLVGRLNRMLGGALAAESFALSQSFYIGRANDAAHYVAQEVRGRRYLDEASDIEPLYPVNGVGAGASAAAGALHDPLLVLLQERGLVKAPIKSGAWALTCPWEHEHNHVTAASSTCYLQANFEGRTLAGFDCKHTACQGRTLRDLRAFLGAGENEPPPHEAQTDEHAEDEDKTEDVGITVAMARLAADWVEAEQRPPPFVVQGLLPEVEAGSFVGPGGISKSTLSLYESVHIILARPLYGRAVLKPGVVLGVSKEDRADLIAYRLKQICRALHLSDADMRRVHGNFLRLDLRGDAFMLQTIGQERIPYRSGDVSALLRTFAQEGIAFAWFDTASRFSTGEGNQEAAVTMAALTALADGWRCAAQALHHVAQSIARTATVDMHASRGGTAFIDNGRFARQLLRHSGGTALPGALCYTPPAGLDPAGELLRMHITKLTGAKYDIDAPIWIERREWEFVYGQGGETSRQSREDRQANARTERAGADDAAILKFIGEQLERQPPARLSQNALVDARDRIVRGISESRVREAIGRLRLDGVLVDVPLPGKVTRGQRTFLAPAGWQEPL